MALEFKNISFQVKDFNKGDRSAVIAFATYDNIDHVKDILRKGAFVRSWNNNKSDIRLFVNHDPNQVPGKPLNFWEDDQHAYVKAFFGTHTLGEDTLKMMDEGIITDASFGYKAINPKTIEVKGEKVRELKEVKHFETSVLTHWGANPLSKVQMVTKGFSFDELTELKESIARMESFCRNTTASDETIEQIEAELKQATNILSRYDDTADTRDDDPAASEVSEDNIRPMAAIYSLKQKFA